LAQDVPRREHAALCLAAMGSAASAYYAASNGTGHAGQLGRAKLEFQEDSEVPTSSSHVSLASLATRIPKGAACKEERAVVYNAEEWQARFGGQ